MQCIYDLSTTYIYISITMHHQISQAIDWYDPIFRNISNKISKIFKKCFLKIRKARKIGDFTSVLSDKFRLPYDGQNIHKCGAKLSFLNPHMMKIVIKFPILEKKS